MKNKSKIALLSFGILTTIVACKDKEVPQQDSVVEEVVEYDIPNKSDMYFSKTLISLGNNNTKDAASNLQNGITSLKEEGKELEGTSRQSLNAAIDKMSGIQKALSANKKININDLQNAMVNAELSVSHDYLITDDVYLFSETKEASDHISQTQFKQNLKVLESTLKNEKENKSKDADGSGQKLYDEGKEIERQLTELMVKIKDHNKRANEHIKTHHKEYYNSTNESYD